MKVISNLRQTGKTEEAINSIIRLLKNDVLLNLLTLKKVRVGLITRDENSSKNLLQKFFDIISKNGISCSKYPKDNKTLILDIFGSEVRLEVETSIFSQTTLSSLNDYDYVIVDDFKVSKPLKETIYFINTVE